MSSGLAFSPVSLGIGSARQHLPLVVTLRNEALVAAAAPSAEPTVAGVYAAAAEELLCAREEALAQMRQAGVSVVDARPQSMAAAVVNRYLELKRPRDDLVGIVFRAPEHAPFAFHSVGLAPP